MRAFGPEFMTQVRWGESGLRTWWKFMTKVIKGETFTSIPQPPGYSHSAGPRETAQETGAHLIQNH